MTKISNKVNNFLRILLVLLGITENKDGKFCFSKLITSGWAISIGVVFGTIVFQNFNIILWIIICISLLFLSNCLNLKEVNQN